MEKLNCKLLAKELLSSLYSDGMVFIVYPDGKTEVTTQTAGYFPVKPLAKIDLSRWYWVSGTLGEYDLENLSEEDEDFIIDYLAEEIEIDIEENEKQS